MSIWQVILGIAPKDPHHLMFYNIQRSNMEMLFIVLLSVFIYWNSRAFHPMRRDFWPVVLALLVVPSHGWYLYRVLTMKIISDADVWRSLAPFIFWIWPLQLVTCLALLIHLWYGYPRRRSWRWAVACVAYAGMFYWIGKSIVLGYYRFLSWLDVPTEAISRFVVPLPT